MHTLLCHTHHAALRIEPSHARRMWRQALKIHYRAARTFAKPTRDTAPRLVAYVQRVNEWRLLVILAPLDWSDIARICQHAPEQPAIPLLVYSCFEPSLTHCLAQPAETTDDW